MTGQLPPPCPKCSLNDGAWRDTNSGLVRCDCDRGTALLAADTRARLARTTKASKAADKAKAFRENQAAKRRAQKATDRKLAAQYRDMPLLDGGDR